jgi:glycosyltransferase involved in cell wall biosynthesis
MNRFLLTPVKNEAALLGAFLKHHADLFDQIIIADQGSTDGSWEIAESHPKVVSIRNHNTEYNENTRRKLLLEEAYKLDPNALVMGLDADEFLLVEARQWEATCEEWATRFRSHALELPWMCLAPGGIDWFVLRNTFCRPCKGGVLAEMAFHQCRVPLGPNTGFCKDIPVLHLNLVWPRRQQMKTWWYSAVETTMRGSISIDTRRVYQRSGVGEFQNREPVPARYASVVRQLLDNVDLQDSWDTWHKAQILQILQSNSADKLRHAPIWGYPWKVEMSVLGKSLKVGPSLREILVDWWVSHTMKRRQRFAVRFVDSVLRLLTCFKHRSESVTASYTSNRSAR